MNGNSVLNCKSHTTTEMPETKCPKIVWHNSHSITDMWIKVWTLLKEQIRIMKKYVSSMRLQNADCGIINLMKIFEKNRKYGINVEIRAI